MILNINDTIPLEQQFVQLLSCVVADAVFIFVYCRYFFRLHTMSSHPQVKQFVAACE